MTTKKSETTNSSAAALEAILDKLGAMESKIETMENRIDAASKPPALTEVKSTDNADPYGEANSIIQSRYGEPKFHVKFVGFGTDGVLYRDLEIVSRR